MTDSQFTRADLEGMSTEQIVEARREGRLNVLLGMSADDADLLTRAKTEDLSAADVERLTRLREYDLITEARHQGRIDPMKEI